MSARRDGRRHCGGRLDGNAMPELPRQYEHGRFGQPRRLVHGTELRELPHRHGDEQQRPNPLHLGLHRHEFHGARAGEPDVFHAAEHSGGRTFAVPFFRRSRRVAMRSLPRLDPRGISQHPRQRQCAEHQHSRPCRRDGGMHGLPHGHAQPIMSAARTECIRWVRPGFLRIRISPTETAPRNVRHVMARIIAARCFRECRPTAP